DMLLDEAEEIMAVAVDAERVGEREGDAVPRVMRILRGGDEGGLGLRPVIEISLQVRYLRRGDQIAIDIFGFKLDAGAEKRVHRTLRIGRYQDQAAPGRRAHDQRLRIKAQAKRCNVAFENLAEV